MILGLIERGEVVPIGLDLRTIGDIEADRAKNRLDALPGAHDRMDPAAAALAPRQRDIQRFLCKACVEFAIGERLPARNQRGFDLVLSLVDTPPRCRPLLDREFAEPLHLLADGAGLAEIAGLDLLELRRRRRSGECARGLVYQLSKRVHRSLCSPKVGKQTSQGWQTKKEASASFFIFVAGSGAEAGLCLICDFCERGLIEHRQIGEHLAIEVDRCFLQTVHERGIRETALAGSGIDARDPQRAKLALAHTPVAVGILPRLHHRFVGDAPDILTAAAETLGRIQYFLVTRSCRYATLDSWHGVLLLGVRQHGFDGALVRRADLSGPAQMALTLGAFLREDVAQKRSAALDAAATLDAKAFGSAALRFHLWHYSNSILDDAGWPCGSSNYHDITCFKKLDPRERPGRLVSAPTFSSARAP